MVSLGTLSSKHFSRLLYTNPVCFLTTVDAKRGRKARQEPAPKRPQEELVGTRQQVELGIVRRVRDVALGRPRKVGSAHLGEQLLAERFVEQLDDGDALKWRRPV